MTTKKHTEYLVPLGSTDRNITRRASHHLGRYHGFDTMGAGAGSNIPITISHTETLDYVDETNTKISVAAFINGHGMVITTDETPTVEVLANSSGVTKYQVLYASYTWADVNPGPSVTYGADGTTSVEPSTPPTMVAVRTPLGYFTIIDGATTIAGVTYTAYDVPNLAGKPDLDLSDYALLSGNVFTGVNVEAYQEVPKSALTLTSGLSAPWYDITLPADGNVFNIAALDAAEYKISSILFGSGRSPVNGETIVIRFAATASTVKWYSGGNITGYSSMQALALNSGADFAFTFIAGTYHPIGMPNWILAELSSLGSRVTTLESESVDYNERLDVLEGTAIPWVDLLTPNTIVGDWTVNHLKKASYKGLTYLKAILTANAAGVAAGDTELVVHVLSVLMAMTLTKIGGHDTVSLTVNPSGDTVTVYNGTIGAGSNLYSLPPTVIR